mgnify:FL=1|jgi:hypothetical protein|tara:strand:+ start:75 stop:344 length:270 start_codon:yes stop_codon:yes gene_type:complete
MSKEVTKITKEELDKVQGFTKVSNDIVYQIGVAAVRKDGLTKDHEKVMGQLEEFKQELNKTYGDVNIDLKDGSITPMEKVEEPAVEEVK